MSIMFLILKQTACYTQYLNQCYTTWGDEYTKRFYVLPISIALRTISFSPLQVNFILYNGSIYTMFAMHGACTENAVVWKHITGTAVFWLLSFVKKNTYRYPLLITYKRIFSI